MRRLSSSRLPVVLTQAVVLALILAPIVGIHSAGAAAGGVIQTGVGSAPPGIIVPGFLFEPEFPLHSLKEVPTWPEVEQLLDNPYLMALDPATPGNDQGWPSYRTRITRRPGFGVTLPQFLIHPLNYNPNIGEEMRLLNPNYPGGTWRVLDTECETAPAGSTCIQGLVQDPANPTRYTSLYKNVTVSPGAGRVAETEIDYNSPFQPSTDTCISSTETFPVPENSTVCGGDPGEPGYSGFGVLNANGYSVPAVPGITTKGGNFPNGSLRDPERGAIQPRNPLTGAGGLDKPSLRIPKVGGSPVLPNFRYNSDANLAARGMATLAPSSENDYLNPTTTLGAGTGRPLAVALGKALFWDMQVGSDGVQSCGTCHFTAGADDRTKNQVNPNHLGGDLSFQLHGGAAPNTYSLQASDFPFHKLIDPTVAGDPACTTPLKANINAGVLENNFPNGTPAGGVTVCDAANIQSDVNDVASSMGVVFSPFTDIPTPGGGVTSTTAFVGPTTQPRPVAPDLRTAGALDPIPGFQGVRRVEPRNTPTFFGVAMNFDNFWDGRARHDFNGGSVFGAADPQSHVFVAGAAGAGPLTPTRQIIRFTSVASLATGPGLSEFEMSFLGRNWSKIGKKLLQPGVTPLANQLVATNDSVLGPYSNQGGSACGALLPAERTPGTPAAGKPGLCISYPALIRRAFRPELTLHTASHLQGCYTDGRTPACAASITPDPFDTYVLRVAPGPAVAADTNQFTQMEGNFSLFWGLSIHMWAEILVPDDSPLDKFFDANPDAGFTLGEPGEPGLVGDIQLCSENGGRRPCLTEVGNFKRDIGVTGHFAGTTPEVQGTPFTSNGTRCAAADTACQRSKPDPLLGMDLFQGSNLSLKNPNFRSARCGECHLGGTLTDHTFDRTHLVTALDFAAEFATPGAELPVEPLGRPRLISGFLLESELNENGQDALERRIINQSIVPNPADGLAYPDATAAGVLIDATTNQPIPWTGTGAAFLDNGIYNLGVRPISEDIGRGGNDAFGLPLSLSTLAMKNVGGASFEPCPPEITSVCGAAMPNVDPAADGFGVFEETAQDQQLNPGFESELVHTLLPAHVAPWVNNITVGDAHPELDEAGGAPGAMYNVLTDVPMLEGFVDALGPFNVAGTINEAYSSSASTYMGTWPNANRVVRNGSFKAPQLREVELTGPYFHNGGKLTLRQVVDFYSHGGDFPISNAAHRDFNIVNLRLEVQSNLTEAEITALVDFLLELTDDRVRFERAPFDHPEEFVPLDGRAPDNTFGRSGLVAGTTGDCNGVAGAGPCFRQIPAVGAGGRSTPLPGFLGVTRGDRSNPNCTAANGPISHYCSKTQ